MGNWNAVERGCAWWADAPEHRTCAVIYASSQALVALICVIVNLSGGAGRPPASGEPDVGGWSEAAGPRRLFVRGWSLVADRRRLVVGDWS